MFLFYPPTIDIICFVGKKIIYIRGSVHVFLRVTLLKLSVLSEFLGEMIKYLKILLFILEILEKKL